MTVTINGSTGIDKVQDGSIQAADLASGVPSTSQLPAGTVLQVVSTTKIDTFSASLSSGSAATVTGLSASITPSSASNKIFVMLDITSHNGSESGCGFIIQRNGSDILTPSSGSGLSMSGIGFGITSGNAPMSNGMSGLDSPSTTSSVTYSVVIRNFSTVTRTLYVNNSPSPQARGVSSITLMEIAA